MYIFSEVALGYDEMLCFMMESYILESQYDLLQTAIQETLTQQWAGLPGLEGGLLLSYDIDCTLMNIIIMLYPDRELPYLTLSYCTGDF